MNVNNELYREFRATQMKKDNKWSKLHKKWIIKLGLQKERFFGLFEEEGDNMFSISKVSWNPLKNYWEIQYKYPQDEYTIIHELGHIYLYKLDGNLEYHKKLPLIVAENRQLAIDINVLEDTFVNYELCKFPEFFNLMRTKARKRMYLHYILPKSKDRVEYIRKWLYRKTNHVKKEINEYLKFRYGTLYK